MLCQLSSTDSRSCPGDDITFTCLASQTALVWTVTPNSGNVTLCVLFRDVVETAMCGPMNRFIATVTGADSSTLTVQSVDDVINGTSVICVDEDVNGTICVTGTIIGTSLSQPHLYFTTMQFSLVYTFTCIIQ